MRIELDPVPGVEQQQAALGQHAAGFGEQLLLVRHEHDAERAHHGAEGLVLERQCRGVGDAPVDLAFHLAARISEHRFAEIARHQAEIRIDALAQPLRDDAGAAGELEHVAFGPHRHAAYQVGGERVQLRRAEDAVVILRDRAAEITRSINHAWLLARVIGVFSPRFPL